MKNRIVFPILSLFALASLTGCNNSSQSGDIVINVTNSISLKEGETYQINITVAGSEDIVIYRSDNHNVATVSSTGLVTALKEGIANITVTTNNYKEIITFTVSKKNTYLWYTIKDDVTDMSFLEGYPWLNTSIYGNIKKIEKPRLEDDYFANVNYDYLQTIDIPEGKERWGCVFEAQDVIDGYLDEIYTANNSKAKTLLDLLDIGAKSSIVSEIERLSGLTDQEILDIVNSKDSLLGLSRLFSLVHVTGNDELRLNVPYTNASKGLNRICIGAFYDNTVNKMANEIVAIASKLNLNITNLYNRMRSCIQKVGHLYTEAYTGDSECKNITTVKDINQALDTTFDVYSMLKSLDIDDNQAIYYSEFTSNYAKCYQSLNTNFWRDYLLLKTIFDSRFFIGAEDYYSLLPNLETVNGELFNQSLSINDMKRDIILNNFYDVFEREYIKRFISSTSREQMLNMIGEIKNEFFNVIQEQTWLSDETKLEAQNKLAAMNYIAFYTDEYITSPEYVVTSNDIFQEQLSYNDYYLTSVSKKRIDNDSLALWPNSTINAAYSSADNNFKIFHGLIVSSINDHISESELYGRYGSTIGHEITHGFDNKGATYDKDGFKSDWWTPEDKAEFEEKVATIQDTYTNFLTGFKDEKFNGKKLSGEVIADMGGLKVALNAAYKKNMNLDEVFRGFAFSYAYVYTEDAAYERNYSDAHPLSYIRCNMTVAQFDLFQQTYNLVEDDIMYIPTEARICIW